MIVFIYVRIGFVVMQSEREMRSIDNSVGDLSTHTDMALHKASVPNDATTQDTTAFENGLRFESSQPHPQHQHTSSTSNAPRHSSLKKGASIITIGTATTLTPSTRRPRLSAAAAQYFKCAILFFIALIITWIPSTINRVHAFVNPDFVSFKLNMVAATVLPLQGFWNALIYIMTSKGATRELLRKFWDKVLARKTWAAEVDQTEMPQRN